ncbi:aminotransferase class I/II-fold pyridoxal phosphate-dependent enzyme [Paenibacillus filicis]|uniref:Aminotransferase class I/II-fold pyridoxal phosphate-dependent enzyme n=1 Tax=Paenibacillus gyeongsangnamensis TaxID=3388067 RepID=A0ABT4QFZ6_9BACL|nr:aminotransferase class I/II-fold pyridoxal phosphate-dependent enzyme [Paenibacillus filicis]MCZ8515777.1 aminotransferase class I/II-fold pyridoxal phosphate-dependent enzyme [Paenibacillus filicis]
MKRLPNLTRYESIGINRTFNVADGHAHQPQTAGQRQIVGRLPELFYEAEALRQSDLEGEFRRLFFNLSGQLSAADLPRTLFCYSASLSTDLIATYLAAHRLSAALLHPCFDNLATILRRRNVPLTPLYEQELALDRLEETWASLTADAVFLTVPNNPTGFELSVEAWERIVGLCGKYDKLLIVDCTFRFFSRNRYWDQYELLERSGIRYLVVEDTGKTWPTQDLKCSILAMSADLHEEILELHNDILLNVSPLILKLLIEYMKDTQRNGLASVIWETIDRNRRQLREAIHSSCLIVENPTSAISVEWLRITDPEQRSVDLVDRLNRLGLGVLPGDHFYWADMGEGERFIRIALARNPVMFAEACGILRIALGGSCPA